MAETPAKPQHNSNYQRLRTQRAQAARDRVLPLAHEALGRLQKLGVEARVTGSLARGTFHERSDVDFLIIRLPDEELRYRLERVIEEAMDGIPFDVVYLDEVSHPELRRRFLEAARDRSNLA
ncbi:MULTISPECIES: nucleotidyltransferase family protein [unclassified Halorhodospira]|uniref:nucleotidyltransferase family protein n=1 Tax=unclassified Halorhodospira TaxID=2626748 RepID=UPI0023789C50|nr:MULTISPECIES: nucleotidyltransferase domain-containing protein [unclassified Halorhodospira]MCG5541548.1 nucleotidyltransferase domain-containing protein [Halorhodospira sp. M39old]